MAIASATANATVSPLSKPLVKCVEVPSAWNISFSNVLAILLANVLIK